MRSSTTALLAVALAGAGVASAAVSSLAGRPPAARSIIAPRAVTTNEITVFLNGFTSYANNIVANAERVDITEMLTTGDTEDFDEVVRMLQTVALNTYDPASSTDFYDRLTGTPPVSSVATQRNIKDQYGGLNIALAKNINALIQAGEKSQLTDVAGANALGLGDLLDALEDLRAANGALGGSLRRLLPNYASDVLGILDALQSTIANCEDEYEGLLGILPGLPGLPK